MKRYLILCLVLTLLPAMTLKAQDSLSLKVADSLALAPTDSSNPAQVPKTTEQLLLELQLQLKQMQEQLSQVQSTVCAPKQPKEIIPAGSKSKSHFYGSLQFGFFFTSDEYTMGGGTSKDSLGTRFSYALKPAFGYLFSDRITAGCKIVFADCRFAGMQTSNSFKYLIANAMIGGGASLSDYITWRVQPYFRYRITRIFWERLNLWGEISAYAGQTIPRDIKTHNLQWSERSVTYGVALSPTITCDLNRNLQIFSTMDLFAWNGSYKVSSGASLHNNSFNFQFIPIFTVLTGLFNIGVIKKF